MASKPGNAPEIPPPLKRLIDLLEGVTHSGGDQYQALCPHHDDRAASLSVAWGDTGKVLLDCKAGCDSADVIARLGLKWSDLAAPSTEEAVYKYADEDNNLKYEVVRRSGKKFQQRRPDPKLKGKWVYNMEGVEPLPYRLPELAEALNTGEEVLIVEGESDVEAARSAYDSVATCNSGGAGKWTTAHSEHFRHTSSFITIIADRDPAGYRHALAVYQSLQSVGVDAEQLEIVHSAVGKDLRDHCSDHGLEDLVQIEPEDIPSLVGEAKKSTPKSAPESRVIVQAASKIRSRRQRFLWEDRLPVGTLTLFAGRGGVGKSTFAIWAAVEAQFGRLPGDFQDERSSVLYVSVEDDWETQMKPRLTAAGADMDAFYRLSIEYTEDAQTGERIPNFPEDIPLIAEAIKQTKARLVILDPITSTIQGDDHKVADVRAVLDPLARLASDTDTVILGIMHFNKGAGHVSDKLSGSHAYRDAARSVILFALDEDNDSVVLSQDKGNYARIEAGSLAYRLVDTVVELDDGENAHVAQVEMLGATSVSVSEIINRPTDVDEVVRWLQTFMAENNGRVDAAEGLSVGLSEGFSKSQIGRARSRCRPKVNSNKGGMASGWEWVTEETANNPAYGQSGFFPKLKLSERVLQGPESLTADGALIRADEELALPEEPEREPSKSRRTRSRSTQGSSPGSSGTPSRTKTRTALTIEVEK
ncbi:AAA family ATPase [Cryobacterium arcticum]|uniref:Toprim domain-containing protein n=1 Tax=Cryobacterium arcticum TaxID=670052 RepID=A0A317ZPV8_9MICO|nr:AAA family ATPase [Cryobacterium arcticum]PXA68531.1 hypothetical protein CTB96_18240 [Cryobacterium arcticum]